MRIVRWITTFALGVFCTFEVISGLRGGSIDFCGRSADTRTIVRAQEPRTFWVFTAGYGLFAAMCFYYVFPEGRRRRRKMKRPSDR